MQGAEEIVLLVVEHRVAHRHTGGYELCDAAFYELLGQLRVLQLVTDGHASPGTDELWQVGVKGVMRKSRHGIAHRGTVVALGEGDTEDA